MKHSSALILAAIVTAFVLVVVGGVTATLLQPTPAQTAPTTPGVPTAQPAPAEQVVPAEQPAPAEPISREQAIQAATDYVGGGTVREAELEREDGRQVYEVGFTNGSEVYVDAQSGQVVYAELSSRPERERDEDEEYDDHDEYEEYDDD